MKMWIYDAEINFDVEMNECRNGFSMQPFTLTPSKAWQAVRQVYIPYHPQITGLFGNC